MERSKNHKDEYSYESHLQYNTVDRRSRRNLTWMIERDVALNNELAIFEAEYAAGSNFANVEKLQWTSLSGSWEQQLREMYFRGWFLRNSAETGSVN